MKDIRTVLPIEQNEKGTQVVSARDMHDFLEIKELYAAWINRMIDYGFTENVDYLVFSKNRKNLLGGRPSKDVAMTLDMAKEIAMIQRTERGKQARQYFIQAEKELKEVQSNHIELPRTPEQMLSLTMKVAERTTKRVDTIENDVSMLKDNMRINGTQEKALLDAHHKSAFRALKGMESNAYKNRELRDKVFRTEWKEFKNEFHLPRYGELPQVKLDKGLMFLNAWMPNTSLRMKILEANNQQTLDMKEEK